MTSTIEFEENDVKQLINLLMLDNAELVKIKEEAEGATTKKNPLSYHQIKGSSPRQQRPSSTRQERPPPMQKRP